MTLTKFISSFPKREQLFNACIECLLADDNLVDMPFTDLASAVNVIAMLGGPHVYMRKLADAFVVWAFRSCCRFPLESPFIFFAPDRRVRLGIINLLEYTHAVNVDHMKEVIHRLIVEADISASPATWTFHGVPLFQDTALRWINNELELYATEEPTVDDAVEILEVVEDVPDHVLDLLKHHYST